MIIKKFQAKTENDAVEAAKKELGSAVVIMNVRKVKRKGPFGFLLPQLTEVTVALEEESEQKVQSLRKNTDSQNGNAVKAEKTAESRHVAEGELQGQKNFERQLENSMIEEKLDSLHSLLEQQLKKLGAMVLVNQMASLRIKEQTVFLLGLQERWQPASLATGLAKRLGQAPGLRILLSHYPHFFSQPPYNYREYPIHLMLAGHAHGGQVRLPFIGAIFCPGQGFFPHYAQGCYYENDCAMVVSRGLGRFPRVFNRPEVIVAELTPQRPVGD